MLYFHAAVFGAGFLFFGITLLTYLTKFKDFTVALICSYILAPLSLFIIPGFDFSTLTYARWACFIWLAASIIFACYYLWQRSFNNSIKHERCQVLATVLAFIGVAVIVTTVVEYRALMAS